MTPYGSASLLAQLSPSGTAATAAFTATTITEITRIVVCNTTNSTATYDLYHDDAAAGFAASNALAFAADLAGNTSATPVLAQDGNGVVVKAGGKIGVREGTGDAITFSIYGVPRPSR